MRTEAKPLRPQIPRPSPGAGAGAASASGAGTGPPDGPEIFIAPRVVDARAFTEFSVALRGLIADAHGQGEDLRAAASQALRTADEFKASTRGHLGRLELAVKAIGRVEELAAESETRLARVTDAASTLGEVEARAAAAIDGRLEAFTRTLDAALGRAEARVAEMEARIAGAIPAVPAGLPDLITRTERAAAEADLALRSLDSVRSQADATRTAFTGSLAEAADRLATLDAERERVRADIEEALDLCAAAGAAMGRRAGELRAVVDAPVAAAAARAEDAAHALAAVVGEADAARALAQRSAADAMSTTEDLRALLDRAEPWRAVLLPAGPRPGRAGPPELPPALREVIDTVRGALARDLAAIGASLGPGVNR